MLFTFAYEAAGASDARSSLRPLDLEGQGSVITWALSAPQGGLRVRLFET